MDDRDDSEEELEHIVPQASGGYVVSKGTSIAREAASDAATERAASTSSNSGGDAAACAATTSGASSTNNGGGLIRKSSLSNSRNSNLNESSSNPNTPKPKKTVGFDLRPRVLYADEDAEIANILSSDDDEQDPEKKANKQKKKQQKQQQQQQQEEEAAFNIAYPTAVQYRSNFYPQQRAYMEYRRVANPAAEYRVVRERKLSQ